MKAELERKRYATARARKQRNEFARCTTRTKMKANAHSQIILFRTPRRGRFSCHKKAYDHALKARVHPASPSVVAALPSPFGGGTFRLA